MKIGAMYSHLNGFEWIQYHQKEMWGEIEKVISSVNANNFRTKISKEKTMKGKKLFSPTDLNKRMKEDFEELGWFESRTNYWVTDDYDLISQTMHLDADKQKEIMEARGKAPIRSAVFGEINVVGKYYVIEDFGKSNIENGKGRIVYIIEKDEVEMMKYDCQIQSADSDGLRSGNEPIANSRSYFCTNNVRVLVLFTDNADGAGNPQNYANNYINQANQALRNSAISTEELTFELAGVQRFNGVADRNNEADILNDMRNDNQLAALRANADADLVLLLTDGNFGGLLGRAFLDQYGDETFAFAFAEIDFPVIVSIHETGHLFGCKHHNDDRTNGNLNSYARAHEWNSGNTESIMFTPLDNQVLQFSNPNVRIGGEQTGTHSRNNVRQLKETALTIHNYENGGDPVEALVSGPTVLVDVGQNFSWAGISCNQNITQYRWSWSSNGWTYYNIGSNSSTLTVNGNTFPSKNSVRTIFIRLIATFANGQTSTDILPVRNEMGSIYYFVDNSTLENHNQVKGKSLVPISESWYQVYPNPTNGVFQLETILPVESNLNIFVFNQLGQAEKQIVRNERYDKGKHRIRIDLSSLGKGVKILRIDDGYKVESLPIIVK